LSLVSILIASIGVILVWSLHAARPPDIPSNLGNWPRIISHIKSHSKDRPLSFAVVGDTKSFGTFEAILKRLQGLDLDFIVNMGDFVHEPTLEDHRYFVQEMANELDPADPPLLLVPGNHDISPTTFPASAFERLYGPPSFSFECAGNLFVFLNNAVSMRKGGTHNVEYLERVLSQRREKVKRIFVLMHKPPLYPGKWLGRVKSSHFMELMKRYHVDYVLAGHLHMYGRIRVGDTTVLISGGGGARLREGPVGKMHHAVIFRLYEDGLTEDIMPVASEYSLEEKLEYLFVTRILPKIQRNPAPWPQSQKLEQASARSSEKSGGPQQKAPKGDEGGRLCCGPFERRGGRSSYGLMRAL
jgi:predicted phosphodiesterase